MQPQQNDQFEGEVKNVVPEYADVKKAYLQEYYQAKHLLSVYMLKPDKKNEDLVRQSLFVLSHSLSFKLYVLDENNPEDKEFKQYFLEYLSRPDKFYNFSLKMIFSICQLIMEKLGFFDVEQSSPYKANAHQEV